MASVPGFSPYPLWSPQNRLGIITESVFALLILCLGPSGSRLFPSCSSRWSPVNQCVRPRVPGLNKIPWTSLGSANSLRSPLTTLLQPFRPEARIPATCTASRKNPSCYDIPAEKAANRHPQAAHSAASSLLYVTSGTIVSSCHVALGEISDAPPYMKHIAILALQYYQRRLRMAMTIKLEQIEHLRVATTSFAKEISISVRVQIITCDTCPTGIATSNIWDINRQRT
ncbi:hypothetical protein BGY98DRAFT_937505 [Russula aff. rugulosa BPL654]|nr:hypothetical protein BGY98DRAFT_937505 [Russula aff. rugulosa BPL654]